MNRYALTLAPLLLAVTACKSKGRCVTEGVAVEIAGNHGHSMSVPGDHVGRTVGGTYPLSGGSHEHAVVLKDDDMKKLAAEQAVTTRTSSVNAHTHEIRVSCK